MRALLLAVILCLPFEIELIVALWPYLPWVGKAFAGLIMTLCICGAVLSVAYVWNVISMWFSRRHFVEVGGLVFHREEDGMVRHLSAEQERAKLLSAPVQVTELPASLSAKDQEIIDRSKVLAAHFEQGKGMHAIEKELGIPYNQVRDWCNTAKALRERQKSW